MIRRSTHVRDGQDSVISETRKVSVVREDVPEMSESDVIRSLLDVGIEHADLSDLTDGSADDVEDVPLTELVGEAALARYRHERFKQLEGWLTNQRSGFRSQVARHFKRRFKNGYNESELSDFSENMRRKAHYLWPGDDLRDERERALRYVDAVEREAVAAVEDSDATPLDPEGLFESLDARRDDRETSDETRDVEDETRDPETFAKVVREAVSRIESTAVRRQDSALADSLANQFDVPDALAEDAVREARSETTEGVSA